MTAYDYYPGCSLKGTGKPYEESLLAVFEALDVGLDELDDWNCCGATAYMAVDEKKAVALASRNLALAEQSGKDLVAPCNACWLVLNKTSRYLDEDQDLNDLICSAIAGTCPSISGNGKGASFEFSGNVSVRHPLDVLYNDVGVEALENAVTNPLSGLRVAPYYGCQIVRPMSPFDDQHDPMTMDHLLAAAGCDVASDYPFKTRCCGASQMMTMPDVGIDLVSLLLEDAVSRDIDVIAVACPLCQFNLEGYQPRVSKRIKAETKIPILYFTQLLGLALGLDKKALGIKRSFVPVEPVLARRASDD
ncbi:MAG: CoB--CoM heterodisulfide reductase iron-sulfur subunit B family protein [Acidimicrobiia bacterium]|nr:CoB--CoM heterodisulfide reductase iron-sulfur subunit B family protein [Acidimicrobiia bacterium]